MSKLLIPPIKRGLIFNWKFKEVSNIDELKDRLCKEYFHVYKLRNDILIVTSKSKPLAIIFIIIQKEYDGGELILIETNLSWYSYE